MIDGKNCQTDLVRIDIGKQKTIWSFLSIGWGLMADIDIDSEKLRKLGAIRFTVYGLIRCMASKVYSGKLSYIEPKLNNSTECDEQVSGDNWTHIKDIFTCVYVVYQTHISKDTIFAPKSKLSDNLMYLTYIRGKLSCSQTAAFLTSIKDGSHCELPFVTVLPVTQVKLEPLQQSRVVVDGENINWKLDDGSISACVVSEAALLLAEH